MKRKYLNSIEVWIKAASDDLAGGNITTDTLIDTSWCNIKSLNRQKLTDYGLNVATQAIKISLRYRDDLDYFQQDIFFKYKGKEWFIDSIHQIDLEEEELEIVATAKR